VTRHRPRCAALREQTLDEVVDKDGSLPAAQTRRNLDDDAAARPMGRSGLLATRRRANFNFWSIETGGSMDTVPIAADVERCAIE